MFSKKTATAHLDAPETIIGKGVVLEAAKLSGKESVRIDGLYRGNIDIEGSLVLGDTGNINGDIKAKYMVAAGCVNGNITCETMLHLASTAKIHGNVASKKLIVDEGSQLHGHYNVGDAQLVENTSASPGNSDN